MSSAITSTYTRRNIQAADKKEYNRLYMRIWKKEHRERMREIDRESYQGRKDIKAKLELLERVQQEHPEFFNKPVEA